MSVSVGDKVLLPEYGGTKLNLDDEVCIMILPCIPHIINIVIGDFFHMVKICDNSKYGQEY